MGFHVCEYCAQEDSGSFIPQVNSQYPVTSSGDVTLHFDSDRVWRMPDMILHYIADHHWLPPEGFVEDVMHFQIIGGERVQSKTIVFAAPQPVSIGYLHGPFQTGEVPDGFIEKLEKLMKQAASDGNREQYRSV